MVDLCKVKVCSTARQRVPKFMISSSRLTPSSSSYHTTLFTGTQTNKYTPAKISRLSNTCWRISPSSSDHHSEFKFVSLFFYKIKKICEKILLELIFIFFRISNLLLPEFCQPNFLSWKICRLWMSVPETLTKSFSVVSHECLSLVGSNWFCTIHAFVFCSIEEKIFLSEYFS